MYEALTLILLLVAIWVTIKYMATRKQLTQAKAELTRQEESMTAYKTELEPLKKYQGILDVEVEIGKQQDEAQRLIQEAKEEADAVIGEARGNARDKIASADRQLEMANQRAREIESEARKKAETIAGDALVAKENHDKYEAAIKAMRNTIKGYGDEYLIPNYSVLDELADEYDHKQAGEKLKQIRKEIKSMVKTQQAANCDYVEAYRRTTAIEFVLDAYNGKIDSIMAKVKHDNYGKLKQQIDDAFELVNHNGRAFRNARINEAYLGLSHEQLKYAVASMELRKIDQEEQRRIREQIREEERAKREYEKAQKEAAKEERLLRKALAEAETRVAAVAQDERAALEVKIANLKNELTEALAKGERATSMAQLTKTGHVYIISNIGSFGEEVVKIGMTRRLEPLDRVKELGDASVPFIFDVHAMIHSSDAPALERALHESFDVHRVNKVNYRKEFFRVPITQIKEALTSKGIEAHWTMKAEAREYRESRQMQNGGEALEA